jgi:hypothetical protein
LTIIVDSSFAFFGMWAIYSHLFIYWGKTFEQMISWIWVPAIAATTFMVIYNTKLSQSQINNSPVELTSSFTTKNAIYYLLFISISLLFLKQYLAFWVLGILYLSLIIFSTRYYTSDAPFNVNQLDLSRSDLIAVVLISVLAVSVTLFANRPDADDDGYLNTAISTLDHPEKPLMSFDGMFGEPDLPFLTPSQKPQTQEILVAAVARICHLSPRTIYYVVFPAFFALLFTFTDFLLLKRLVPRLAFVALIATFFFIISWGDSHRTYGNFGFVRLFQGKGVFVTLAAPAIVYYALRWLDKPCWKSFAWLVLILAASISFTSTGVFVAPLALFISLIAALDCTSQRLKTVFFGILACFYPVLISLAVLLDIRQPVGLAPSNLIHIWKVLDGNLRCPLAVLGFLAIPLLAVRGGASTPKWLTRYVAFSTLLLLNGLAPMAIGRHTVETFSWRILWAAPFPMFLGLAFALALGTALEYGREGNRKAGNLLMGAVVLYGALFFFGGQSTLSSGNGVTFGLPGPKVDPDRKDVAEFVLENSSKEDLALLPEEVAILITGYPRSPRLINIRSHYLVLLGRIVGRSDAESRRRLSEFVTNPGPVVNVPWFLDEIDARGIRVICFHQKLTDECGRIRAGLLYRGFVPYQIKGYEIWISRQNGR